MGRDRSCSTFCPSAQQAATLSPLAALHMDPSLKTFALPAAQEGIGVGTAGGVQVKAGNGAPAHR